MTTVHVHIKHLTLNQLPAAGKVLADASELPIAPYTGTTAQTAHGYTKVLADGSQVDGTDPRTDHVAVIDHATSLMWAVESLGNQEDANEGISQQDCIKRCQELRLLGYGDWHLPSRRELSGLIDDTRYEPAIDASLFPRVKPCRHWTSTAAAWSESSAWGVYFSGGFVDCSPRSYYGFALAVRRAGQ